MGFNSQTLLKLLKQKSDLILLSGVLFLSFFSFFVFSDLDLVTAYNDSMSHLNLSRMIIDNQEPGISQVGGVWLPLNHILPLLFIWNDYAWHSGFAGASFSMLSYILSTVLIFKSIIVLTGKRLAAFVGSLTFAFNLNNLYLQSTPLTESLYLLFFIASAYFILKWIVTQDEKYLPLAGLTGFFQVLTRYDGWFVCGLEVFLLFLFEYIYNKKSLAESFSKMILVSVPIGFGIGVWVLWNQLIFGNPLYFALGPYSAHTQQEIINESSPLITKGDLAISVKAYYFTVINNIGLFTTVLGIFGSIAFLTFRNKISSVGVRGLIFLLFFTPVIFNILALYLGFSIINIPDLNWRPKNDETALWFNVRYGIMALPAVAILIGVLAASPFNLLPKRNSFKIYLTYPLSIVAILVILFQAYITFNEGIITVIDGTRGSSSYLNSDVSSFLKKEVKPEDEVLLAVSYYNPVAFQSHVDLNQIIHEGVSQKWGAALANPESYANWIVMSNGRIGEPVYEALIEKEQSRFLKYYDLEYRGKHANVYKRKQDNLVSKR